MAFFPRVIFLLLFGNFVIFVSKVTLKTCSCAETYLTNEYSFVCLVLLYISLCFVLLCVRLCYLNFQVIKK